MSNSIAFLQNGLPVTTSVIISHGIQLSHEPVIKLIRKYLDDLKTFGNVLFETESFKTAGGTQKREITILNEPQTTLLLTFFKNTEIVRKFKVALVQKFYELRNQLQAKYCPALNQLETLTPAQQHQIQTAVAARAQKTAHNYQTIYRALKNRFQVARYDQIPQSQFKEALRFIQSVDLSVPETPITTAPPETYVVDEDFLKTLQVFCYYQRYLFRKPLMQAMRVMLALDVPDASKLWDSANDFNFVKLERLLDDLGFSVKELDCYKHWALTHTA